ncbi:hypothetical protein [Nocardia sp. alder85J]|uniref:hypothetical protein n=1 Tax=Nocardia sp. alder85J TaxID=2862949 RepID=UPI001CD5C572|nr:hypothetical protein [Nocardia sp. alder85J]MCX4095343.1 hypothetical protein [Nocardia sp. alder85J]
MNARIPVTGNSFSHADLERYVQGLDSGTSVQIACGTPSFSLSGDPDRPIRFSLGNGTHVDVTLDDAEELVDVAISLLAAYEEVGGGR